MTSDPRLATRPGLKQAIIDRLTLGLGILPANAKPEDWLSATSQVLREVLMLRWHETNALARRQRLKHVAYMSMEFLIARNLASALAATGLEGECRAALASLGVDLDDVMRLEQDPALGNGGLGRLAACFLDSMASLGVPATGYGIRFAYGMFKQELRSGWQIEQPEDWSREAKVWEVVRPSRQYRIRFGGKVHHRGYRAHWVDTEDLFAIAHDLLIAGQGQLTVNTLRLWDTQALHPFDLAAFNAGRYLDASAERLRAETLTRILYPDDSTQEGRELRLRQEHFFVSASLQDIVHDLIAGNENLNDMPERVAIHLNDTHPALAPAELMRLLVDEHGIEWDDAWRITQQTFTYTNHTLMPEALEVWACDTLQRIVPRHLEIIEEIDRRFVADLRRNRQADERVLDRTRIVERNFMPRVNMGRLSVVASHKVNGVSELHSALLADKLFPDYAALWPERFENVTNGISPRLWLMQANPRLASLIDDAIGQSWRGNIDEIADLKVFADDAGFRDRFLAVKRANKERLARLVERRTGISIDPSSMFDVQVKRIHEYKRQLLNILGVIARWNALRDDPHRGYAPRTVIMAGKAASAYQFAKLIIKLACDVAARINADPATSRYLKFVFLPNYNVSLAEILMPAADLSQQISLAGTEASGTGNMKLALNGALTVGTYDGANIEIAAAVGNQDLFIFGLTVEEVQELRRQGYVPYEYYLQHEPIRRALDQITIGEFSPDDPGRFRPIVDSLLRGGDHYMVLADFPAYRTAQIRADQLWLEPTVWAQKAVRNVAGMSRFSADRAIREYADRIWKADMI
jgi:glycogen phosphorylase